MVSSFFSVHFVRHALGGIICEIEKIESPLSVKFPGPSFEQQTVNRTGLLTVVGTAGFSMIEFSSLKLLVLLSFLRLLNFFESH
jgi:hypothetical protein